MIDFMIAIQEQLPEILAHLPAHISETARIQAAKLPNHIALLENSGSWTFSELARIIAAARNWLADQGVRAGDRVMIINENCRTFVAVWLAVAELDAWPVVVSARLSDSEIDAIRDHCDPRLIIYTSAISVLAKAHAERHSASTHHLEGLDPLSLGPLNEASMPEPVGTESRYKVATLIYTSGTTGRPKGVMLTHQNLLYMAYVSGQIRSLSPRDCLYGVLPIAHIVGLAVLVLGALMYGSTLHLEARFNPAVILKLIEDNKLTILLGTPAMYALIVKFAEAKALKSLPKSALRIISTSGAPLDLAVKVATEALFGLPLHNGYGLSECSPTIAQTRPDKPRSDCSVGPVLPGIEVRLVGVDGNPVEAGGVGELWLRGPNIMKGYYRAPEETALVLDKDGWFNTRDLVRFEQDHLFIVGRTKEMIIRFGFNVYPAEI
jgi:acyl-CoA synthetase (AMP-forming)/AMP-acid ligase II